MTVTLTLITEGVEPDEGVMLSQSPPPTVDAWAVHAVPALSLVITSCRAGTSMAPAAAEYEIAAGETTRGAAAVASDPFIPWMKLTVSRRGVKPSLEKHGMTTPHTDFRETL